MSLPCSGTSGKQDLLKAFITHSNDSGDMPENPLARTLILSAISILTCLVDR